MEFTIARTFLEGCSSLIISDSKEKANKLINAQLAIGARLISKDVIGGEGEDFSHVFLLCRAKVDVHRVPIG